ncbi:kinesin-like protein KIF21A [Planococcus citri]|uniref:kinesin-like protein KIF21A n=1 Tax=Planococcus citri TaxID=170843 RepID=UPI0031F9414D
MSEDSCIKVGVRIRPQIAREIIDSCRICTSVTPGEPQITLGTDKSFTYDYVFDMQDDQQTVYEKCAAPLVKGSLEGYNATILAYGQTGSGKTYTMGSGFDVEIESHQIGIIPRAINQLFDGIRSVTEEALMQNKTPPRFTIYAQFLELYNEDVIDLFDTTKDYTLAKTKSGIKIHEDAKHSIYLSGVTSKAIHSAEEALQCLRQGALSRTTASTQMNAQSSRSHAIFTLHIEQKKIIKLENGESLSAANGYDNSADDCETLTAKFHFVDLAGSERLKRTGATGDRAKEGISINCGLLALGNVISALGDKSKKVSHVPYRDSKLTRLLQDSLGGNSRTVMIACISPSDRDFMETLNTLMYANRARNIQNKVVLNQDKSSRTILMLRQEIQQLQTQLLEYKQGKRIINEDGTETVNDMYLENTMLQTDVTNLRIRLKAMQETIDALNVKNTQLLTEKATGVWLAAAAEGENAVDPNMTEMIQAYLKEVEELRAKLLESEYLCSQLRKQVNRRSIQGGRNMSLSNSLSMAAHCDNEDENAVECLLAVAKKDVEKNKEILSRTKSNPDNEDSFPSEEEDSDESDSDMDEDADSDKNSEYSQELAELTSEINVKQKLIDELETAQKRINSMRQHYEDKLLQLQTTIKQTQQERDAVLSSYGAHSNQPTDKLKKIKEEYETKISSLTKELKNLQSAKKEHARLLRGQTQYESQIKTLKVEVSEMKRTKVKLINKMKEEANKHHEEELRRNREIAQLRKESRRAENLIRSLETKNRVKDVVLKRKQEEVSALRKAARTNKMSSKAAGRPNEMKPPIGASPKVAKQKWQQLEKNISDNTFNRQSIVSLERELVRLMEKRKTLHATFQDKSRKLTDLMVNQPRNKAQKRDLEDEIEQIRANLDYYNDSIKEVQQNIIEIEESKVNFETGDIIAGMGVPEIAYIVEKLYNMVVYHSSQAALREATCKEMEARLTEVEKERSVEQQLIRHMLEVRNNESELKVFNDGERGGGDGSESESESSTQSDSPPVSTASNDTSITTVIRTNNLPGDNVGKFRRRTAVPEELLFSQTASKAEVQDQQFLPVINNLNVNNNMEPPISTNFSIMKVPSASAVLKGFNKPEAKSPQFSRKTYDRQESTSPKIPRRLFTSNNTNLIGKPGSMDRGLNKMTPPNSPPIYKRFNSRDENVFSRLTSSTIQPIERCNGKGIISQYQGKTTMKSPLICTHLAEGHSRAVLALSATDDVLFSASKDKTVKVWDLHEGAEMATLTGHPNSVTSVQYDEKSWIAYTVSSAYIKVWDMRYNKCIKTLSSSGIVNNNLNYNSTQLPVVETPITDIALNNDGKLLYAACGDKVKIWDLRKFAMSGKLSGGHQAAVMCMAVGKLTNEEDLVITGSKDHYIKIFEVPNQGIGTFSSRVTLEPPHYDGVQSLALRDNVLFSGSRDYVIKKWDLDSKELLTSINNAHRDWVCGLAFVQKQPILVSVCRSGILKLWFTDTCTQIGEMKAHDSSINAITTNSSQIFTASHDNTIKIWRLSNKVDFVYAENS